MLKIDINTVDSDTLVCDTTDWETSSGKYFNNSKPTTPKRKYTIRYINYSLTRSVPTMSSYASAFVYHRYM